MVTKKKDGTTTKPKCCATNGILSLPKEVETGLCKLGGLDKLMESLPDQKALDDMAFLHNAMSDPIRLRILSSLKKCDLCPCVLKEITNLSDSRLSYHLNVLEGAGLVTQSSHRRWRIYSLTKEGERRLVVGLKRPSRK
jgi:DNA-binding transcriptional ArsR family regulator